MKSYEYRSTDFILFIAFLIITSVGIILLGSMDLDGNLFRFLRDSLGNIGGVVTCSFFFIWYYKYIKAKTDNFLSRLIVTLCVFIGMVIYEIIQIFLPWSTFDVKDIWASLVGAIIAIILNVFVISVSGRKTR